MSDFVTDMAIKAELLRLKDELAKARELLTEAVIKVENDRTLWTAEWQTWLLDARVALTPAETVGQVNIKGSAAYAELCRETDAALEAKPETEGTMMTDELENRLRFWESKAAELSAQLAKASKELEFFRLGNCSGGRRSDEKESVMSYDRLQYRRSLGLPGTSGFKGMEDDDTGDD